MLLDQCFGNDASIAQILNKTPNKPLHEITTLNKIGQVLAFSLVKMFHKHFKSAVEKEGEMRDQYEKLLTYIMPTKIDLDPFTYEEIAKTFVWDESLFERFEKQVNEIL